MRSAEGGAAVHTARAELLRRPAESLAARVAAFNLYFIGKEREATKTELEAAVAVGFGP